MEAEIEKAANSVLAQKALLEGLNVQEASRILDSDSFGISLAWLLVTSTLHSCSFDSIFDIIILRGDPNDLYIYHIHIDVYIYTRI